MKVRDYVWGRCPSCKELPQEPLPEGWSYTVRTKRTQKHPILYIHTPDCPKGFKKVHIPDE